MGGPLNNCARYEVLDMVEWLYGKPQDYGVIGQVRYQEQDDQGQLYEFDQTEFCPNQNCQKISMANTGYIYIPNSCKDTQCTEWSWVDVRSHRYQIC